MDSQQNAPRLGALNGVRVLDLSRILAGPWATQLLADLGAEVIKVEHPEKGDDTRHWGVWATDAHNRPMRVSDYFLCANRNKKSIGVNIASPAGQQIIKDLVKTADVLVENYKTGQLKTYGLDYASLAAINKRLIYCSITGFGQDGPYARRAGYDFVIQGMSGLMSITGLPDGAPGGGPMKAGVAIADVTTGLYAANAIQAALLVRHRTQLGQHIDLSLLEVQLACLANYPVGYLATGKVPTRLGNAHATIVPYQDFGTADGRIIIAIGNDDQFVRLAAALGHPELSSDPRFRTNDLRTRNRSELISILNGILQSRTTRQWIDAFESKAIPSGPINDLAQAFECPQVVARGVRIDIDRKEGPPVHLVANPIHLSNTPIRYDTAPPELGQDTNQVLHDLLNLPADEIDRLRAAKII